MKLANCAKLARGPETRVWYRAIQAKFWQTALQTLHTRDFPSRYYAGPTAAVQPFEILYLTEDQQVALYEVRAVFSTVFPPASSRLVPNPHEAWTILNVRVTLQQVADLTRVSEQDLLGATAQELTGDWEGYQKRTTADSVSQPVGVAPTQALGQALFAARGLEGFRTVSARVPSRMILAVFPEKLLPGSFVEFSDGAGNSHRIEPRPKRRRRSP